MALSCIFIVDFNQPIKMPKIGRALYSRIGIITTFAAITKWN